MSLRSFQIQNTYKDLLTVLDTNSPNSGLENTAKRVFDGEGISSPLFLSRTSVEIAGGLSVSSGIAITDGNISSQGHFSFKSRDTELLSIKDDGKIVGPKGVKVKLVRLDFKGESRGLPEDKETVGATSGESTEDT